MKTQESYHSKHYFIFCVILLSIFFPIQGCYYYKVTHTIESPTITLKNLQAKNMFFIVHLNNYVWNLTDLQVIGDTIHGTKKPLVGHEKFRDTKANGATRYKKFPKFTSIDPSGGESYVLNEVHIYISNYFENRHRVTIPVQCVNKVEVYGPAKGRTVLSWTGCIIGPLAGISGIVGIIILATFHVNLGGGSMFGGPF